MDIEKAIDRELGNKKITSECPNCGNEVVFNYSQLMKGETIECSSCEHSIKLEADTSEIRKAQKDIDKSIKDLKKTISDLNRKLKL
jgi:predicted RNA-binding Zn-ribbon protein involved in translation (DUF1610 family)